MTDEFQITTPALAWGAATDTGRVRTENEDAFVAEPLIFGVADGMGGHQAGEVASAIAAATLRDRLSNGAPSVDVAVATVVEANASIFQGAHSNAAQRGMGTTLTAMVVLADTAGPRRLAVLNVGDSRTYVMRGGRLRRVSIDHSYVQELVSTGHITEYEARSHPRRNIVTRALGIEPHVRVDTWVLPFVQGDRYVLCSDGLVDEVDDLEIAQLLITNPGPQAAAEALVAAANEHGGRDNVTVVVVDVLEGADAPDASADLDMDLAWESDADEHDRLIDADAAADDLVVPVIASSVGPTSGARTQELPVVPLARKKARFGLGGLLFAVTLGVIAMLTVVLVLVVRNNADSDPDPTTTSSTSSTSTTSTTTSTTSTTVPTTTTVAATAVPGAPTTASGG